ncbi:MAG: RagB/SusD family nutrient uptake outer membrane protein, partial [Bacteroidales bacterium]|nr:RagB/SusD family nutrient uptake outer membrane protein [Bacteroidales bacterium]
PLLMLYKAECLARAGQVGDAMEVLNSLRQRRFVSGSNYELTASEVGDALDYIYDESRRELGFTIFTFFNIRRLNALHDANISLNRIHTVTGENISLPANHPKWTLPIPRYNITLDPELTQNPRN